MLIPSIFGTTRDKEIIYLADNYIQMGIKLDDSWLEIHPNEAKLSINKNTIKIIRKKLGTNYLTWIGLYRSAYEIGLKRDAGYYGAGVWIINNSVNLKYLFQFLNDLADQISNLALNANQFVKPLADIKSDLKIPSYWSQLIGSIKNLENIETSDIGETIYLPVDLDDTVIKSIDHLLKSSNNIKLYIGQKLFDFFENEIIKNKSLQKNYEVIKSRYDNLQKKISIDDKEISTLHEKNSDLVAQIQKLKRQDDENISKKEEKASLIFLILPLFWLLLFLAIGLLIKFFSNNDLDILDLKNYPILAIGYAAFVSTVSLIIAYILNIYEKLSNLKFLGIAISFISILFPLVFSLYSIKIYNENLENNYVLKTISTEQISARVKEKQNELDKISDELKAENSNNISLSKNLTELKNKNDLLEKKNTSLESELENLRKDKKGGSKAETIQPLPPRKESDLKEPSQITSTDQKKGNKGAETPPKPLDTDALSIDKWLDDLYEKNLNVSPDKPTYRVSIHYIGMEDKNPQFELLKNKSRFKNITINCKNFKEASDSTKVADLNDIKAQGDKLSLTIIAQCTYVD